MSVSSSNFHLAMESVTTVSFSSAVAALPERRLPTVASSLRSLSGNRTSRSSLSTGFLCSPSFLSGPSGSVSCDFYGIKVRPDCLNPAIVSRLRGKRGVVTMVIPFSRGSAWEQPPPDLASYLYKNRIVYLGMSLVPSVTELILAEFLYLQYEDAEKPI